MGAPDCERVIERPEGRRKLKLRWSSHAGPVSHPTNYALPGNRRANRTHRCTSVLPKCPPSGAAQNAAIKVWPSLFLRAVQRAGCGRGDAGLSPVWAAVAPGCMAGYLWPSTARRPLKPRIFPCRTPRKRGPPTGIPRACASGAKIRGSGRGAALRLPFARLWQAPALFRLPGHERFAIATGHSPTRWRKTMRNIAEFTLIGRVGAIKQVGKTVRVSICANYPFKDDKGQWKDDAHWNEVTIFTKAIQSYVNEHLSKGDLVHVRGRLRQNSFERDGQRVYTVDLIALELGRLAQASERAAA
jgi:single-strand DNA-binding protein